MNKNRLQMKQITYLSVLAILVSIFAGCRQNDVLRYDKQRAAIEFPRIGAQNSSTFSFRMQEAQEVVVNIPIRIVGYPSPQERSAKFTVLLDSTTALSGQYEILDAIVPANSYEGTLRVRVTNDKGADFEDSRIWILAADGEEFLAGNVERNFYVLRLTNRLPRPTWWIAALQTSLGSYSPAYYTFIMETTGITVYPMIQNITVDGVLHPMWSPGQNTTFILQLREALRERNERVGSPLMHDDAEGVDLVARGQEVIVGFRYR